MRVIAGKYRRRTLTSPPGIDITRPTADRVRESLFNILAPYLVDSLVVDLFAGSGALGIEALSRGARRALFVEKDPSAFKHLKENLTRLGVPAHQAAILNCSVEEFLDAPAHKLALAHAEEFAASTNLVFADPPHASGWYDHSIAQLEKSGLCHAETLAVIEMSSKHLSSVVGVADWTLWDERKYGAARLEIWQRTAAEPSNEDSFGSLP